MPPSVKFNPARNQVLSDLPDKISAALRPHLELVSFKLNDVLFRPGDPVRYLYFPLDCAVSLLASMADGKNVEVGLIGSEGLVGLWAVLGAKMNRYEGVVQISGNALRIEVSAFLPVLRQDGVLLDQVNRYTRYLMAQIAQTAACNRVHRLEQRLARWLLMSQNRNTKQLLPATHEFLSHMLGTDRSEVTIAAGILRKAGLISYQRGDIKILDRKGLESASCECYQVLDDELRTPR